MKKLGYFFLSIFILGLGYYAQSLEVSLHPVADGFDQPVSIKFDNLNRMYVVEHGGKIWIVENGIRHVSPLIDLSDRIHRCGEAGMRDMEFAPNYTESGIIYVTYQEVVTFDGVLARCHVPSKECVKLFQIDTAECADHGISQLAFGSDGILYIAMGDGNQPFCDPQDFDCFYGKILRMNVHTNEVQVCNAGLRNPFHFGFGNGFFYIGDVGSNSAGTFIASEEVNAVPESDPCGYDFGWQTMEGNDCWNDLPCSKVGLTRPVFSYHHEQPEGCSGSVVVGHWIDNLLISGDFCSSKIFILENQNNDWFLFEETEPLLPPEKEGQFGRGISDIGQDGKGDTYLSNFYDGTIYEIRLEAPIPTPTLPPTPRPTINPTPEPQPSPTIEPSPDPTVLPPTETPISSPEPSISPKPIVSGCALAKTGETGHLWVVPLMILGIILIRRYR